MKSKCHLIICLFLFSCVTHGFGQNLKLRIAPDLSKPDALTEEQIEQIITTVETVLNDYAALSKMTDSETRRVTEASVERFNKLFTPSARVMKDYMEYIPAELYPFKAYSLEVYNLLRLKGVQSVIESAELIEIKKDAVGFYIPVVSVRKRMFTALNSNGESIGTGAGREVLQKMYFDIFEEDLSRADIGKIAPAEETQAADNYTRIISFSAGVGTTAFNATNSAFWTQNHASAGLDFSGGLDFSVGAEFMTDKFITAGGNSDRKLALSFGLRYSSYQLKTALRSFSLEFDTVAVKEIDNTSAPYRRLVGPVTADETLRFGVLEIPVGVSYRLLKKKTALVYLYARLIPAFTLGGSGSLSGNALYDARLYIDDPGSPNDGNVSEFRILRGSGTGAAVDSGLLDQSDGFAAYRVGNMPLEGTPAPQIKGSGFAFQFSPTAYIDFSDDNPGFGLMAGLDLTYRFGSFLAHDPVSSVAAEPFRFSDVYAGSLPGCYVDSMTGFSYGLRIGLYQKLSTQP